MKDKRKLFCLLNQQSWRKKTDWSFFLNIIQTAIAIYNAFFK